MTLKIKFAWVWYSFVYDWFSTLPNHLRFHWYHYKFCKERGAPMFFPETYLQQWENIIRKRLQKYPNQIIPSHGLIAILGKMQIRQTQIIVAFLESENVDQGIDTLIQELKSQENNIPLNEENHNPLSTRSSSSAKIHTRTYVIALNIYYQLRNKKDEYSALTYSPAKFEKELQFHFAVKDLSTSLYKVIHFDYKKALDDPDFKGLSQLKKQFEQIITTPEVFTKEIIKRTKEIYEKYFL